MSNRPDVDAVAEAVGELYIDASSRNHKRALSHVLAIGAEIERLRAALPTREEFEQLDTGHPDGHEFWTALQTVLDRLREVLSP